jgi:hypothetical protein
MMDESRLPTAGNVSFHAVTAHRNAGEMVSLSQERHQRISWHVRQAEVADDQVKPGSRRDIQRMPRRLCRGDPVAGAFQESLECGSSIWMILDDENFVSLAGESVRRLGL